MGNAIYRGEKPRPTMLNTRWHAARLLIARIESPATLKRIVDAAPCRDPNYQPTLAELELPADDAAAATCAGGGGGGGGRAAAPSGSDPGAGAGAWIATDFAGFTLLHLVVFCSYHFKQPEIPVEVALKYIFALLEVRSVARFRRARARDGRDEGNARAARAA